MTDTILVVEQQRWHAPQLEREFAADDVHVRLLPQRNRVLNAVEESVPRIVILHIEDRFADALQLMDRLRRLPANLHTLAIFPPAARSLEWMLRELTATEVVFEPVPYGKLAAACRRILRRAHV